MQQLGQGGGATSSFQAGQVSGAVKTETGKVVADDDVRESYSRRRGCHVAFTLLSPRRTSSKGDAIQLFLKKGHLLFRICFLWREVISDFFHIAVQLKCNLICLSAHETVDLCTSPLQSPPTPNTTLRQYVASDHLLTPSANVFSVHYEKGAALFSLV